MLRTSELEYELPGDRIATHPAEPRDSARLLVVPRAGTGAIEHASVRDLPRFLRPGDLLVLNTTAVLAARFMGVNEGTGAHVQGLYLNPAGAEPRRWRVLLKMRRHREGARIRLFDRNARESDVSLVLEGRAAESEDGGWVVRVESPDAAGVGDQHILGRVGLAPLPPYILASRKREPAADGATNRSEDEHDLRTYQTVYADPARAGSVAAPTAGLHFTPSLLGSLEGMGVRRAHVVLHVGMGTFKPVETEFVEQHPIHAEWCTLPASTARAITATRESGGRVIAVGTTTARTLESFPDLERVDADISTATRLLITPGYRFRNIDGLLTNFHLPRSTLLALVGALFDRGEGGGVRRLLDIYGVAIAHKYRFYSFGDAMLVVDESSWEKTGGVAGAAPLKEPAGPAGTAWSPAPTASR